MKKIILQFLRSYKKSFSPFLSSFSLIFPVACKFYPTCSEYSFEAVKKYGMVRGVFLTLKRILHCHPFSKGGVDIVN
ncbi:MAG: membrane protein insertion efficiency factor YidD [Candidatus Yanofskybacteria bacterium RIFCSPHIGHO2_02_FULL_43_15c]|uniref:Putative membrane protein insertion efficiency factor n=2 Tax=Candidatus Yanofskyibacteriota TaxID=1752733 RepID=A0A1F8H170_9BACT|nr:MAG: membrane protein insertion efficiency factor YidD [Candidatus Yanofskybacteria bacterium RIFCSPHIGHO2_02_FULL_43_15c]OGN30648.1 MAG: membrane protein insertion efficiency factor YidD [Candidatus Yanofskybacteria bacterium RIFCSPLOWO2_02_FULL_43_10b]